MSFYDGIRPVPIFLQIILTFWALFFHGYSRYSQAHIPILAYIAWHLQLFFFLSHVLPENCTNRLEKMITLSLLYFYYWQQACFQALLAHGVTNHIPPPLQCHFYLRLCFFSIKKTFSCSYLLLYCRYGAGTSYCGSFWRWNVCCINSQAVPFRYGPLRLFCWLFFPACQGCNPMVCR